MRHEPGAEAAAAARDASRAHRLFEWAGHAPGQSAAQDTLGQAMAALGRFYQARRHFERAAEVATPMLVAEAGFHLALLELGQGRIGDATRIANQLLEAALSQHLDPIRRWVTLLTAAIALRVDAHCAAAVRWLRALLADADLDFDLRRQAQALLATTHDAAQPMSADPGAELLPELGEFLRQLS